MKTILYAGCYLDGYDAIGNNRLERNIRYVNYYTSIREELGFEKIFLLDNGSNDESICEFLDRVDKSYLHFKSLENLKSDDPSHYPYCWRVRYYTEELIKEGYEKIITIDSDCFVLSKRLAKYIKELNTGWTAMWCEKWQFPEDAMSILCKDSFHLFKNFIRVPVERRYGSKLEFSVPFTRIEEGFIGDRYGEDNIDMSEDMDFYAQAGPNIIPRLK